MNKNYNTSDYLSQLNKSKDNQKPSNCKVIKVNSRYKNPAAVKELEDAYLAHQQLKHPVIPDKVFVKMQFRDFILFIECYRVQLKLIELRKHPINTCVCLSNFNFTLGSLVNQLLNRYITRISKGGVSDEKS